MLEATQHKSSVFVTLTYDDEHLPRDGSVRPREMQLFLKRLRKETAKLRFFGVGEYGENTLRPHYHFILFNYPICWRGRTDQRKTFCCEACETIKKAWGKGAIEVTECNAASAAYTAGYVTDKINAAPLPKALHPVFTRMSLRPGLGADVMDDLASTLLEHNLEKEIEDVPTHLQHGKKKLPLGRYLRRRLRARIGRDPGCPQTVFDRAKEEMQHMRATAAETQSTFRKVLEDSNKQKITNIMTRHKIWKSRKTI